MRADVRVKTKFILPFVPLLVMAFLNGAWGFSNSGFLQQCQLCGLSKFDSCESVKFVSRGFYCFPLTSASTTAESASVVMSPIWSVWSSAILRRMRRMILPERVLGRPGAN